jgi:hypothetical protein
MLHAIHDARNTALYRPLHGVLAATLQAAQNRPPHGPKPLAGHGSEKRISIGEMPIRRGMRDAN